MSCYAQCHTWARSSSTSNLPGIEDDEKCDCGLYTWGECRHYEQRIATLERENQRFRARDEVGQAMYMELREAKIKLDRHKVPSTIVGDLIRRWEGEAMNTDMNSNIHVDVSKSIPLQVAAKRCRDDILDEGGDYFAERPTLVDAIERHLTAFHSAAQQRIAALERDLATALRVGEETERDLIVAQARIAVLTETLQDAVVGYCPICKIGGDATKQNHTDSCPAKVALTAPDSAVEEKS